MNIDDTDILNKIIHIQSCIIKGEELKVLLHKDRNFYLDKTDADLIIIYINNNGKVHQKYVMERHGLFAHILHKYAFHKKTLAWNTFVNNHYLQLISGNKYYRSNDMDEILTGILTKREASALSKELEINNTVMMSLYDYEDKEIMGIICFLFRKDNEIDIQILEEIKNMFTKLLQPLYDKKYNIVYNHCVRVDENFSLMTDKEKQIVKKVLSGKSYVEIAELLHISINTLKTHMKNIFNKYNVNSKIELYNKLNSHPK